MANGAIIASLLRASITMVLQNVRDYKICVWSSDVCHNVHTKFHGFPSSSSVVKLLKRTDRYHLGRGLVRLGN
jgi:hypothetical protein